MIMPKKFYTLCLAAVITGFTSLSWAVGLGEAHLKSALNQSLDVTLPFLGLEGIPVDEITVTASPTEDFDKTDTSLKINRLEFISQRIHDGRGLIHITSDTPIKEPFFSFLVKVDWPNGRLVREYTVLLEPSTFTPEQMAAEGEFSDQPSRYRPLPVARPAPNQAKSTLRRHPHRIHGAKARYHGRFERYGPVREGQSLWGIAAQMVPNGQTSVQQVMATLYLYNKTAFLDNNINGLMAGVTLRVPPMTSQNLVSNAAAGRLIAQHNHRWAGQFAAGHPRSVPWDASKNQPRRVYRRPAGPASTIDTRQRLRLVSPRMQHISEGETGNSGLQHQLSLSHEALETATRRNTELAERLQQVENQMASMQAMLKLKEQELQALRHPGQAPTPPSSASHLVALPSESHQQQAMQAEEPTDFAKTGDVSKDLEKLNQQLDSREEEFGQALQELKAQENAIKQMDQQFADMDAEKQKLQEQASSPTAAADEKDGMMALATAPASELGQGDGAAEDGKKSGALLSLAGSGIAAGASSAPDMNKRHFLSGIFKSESSLLFLVIGGLAVLLFAWFGFRKMLARRMSWAAVPETSQTVVTSRAMPTEEEAGSEPMLATAGLAGGYGPAVEVSETLTTQHHDSSFVEEAFTQEAQAYSHGESADSEGEENTFTLDSSSIESHSAEMTEHDLGASVTETPETQTFSFESNGVTLSSDSSFETPAEETSEFDVDEEISESGGIRFADSAAEPTSSEDSSADAPSEEGTSIGFAEPLTSNDTLTGGSSEPDFAESSRSAAATEESSGIGFADNESMLPPAESTAESSLDSSADTKDLPDLGAAGLSMVAKSTETKPVEDDPAVYDDDTGMMAEIDEVSIKLDLAKAYLDLDDKEGAREILQEVLDEGDAEQKQEAENLLADCEANS